MRQKLTEHEVLINELKEENQALGQERFGLKRAKGRKSGGSPGAGETPVQMPKKRGPPFGCQGNARRTPEPGRVGKTVVLRLDSCPSGGNVLKELESYGSAMRGRSSRFQFS